MLNQTRIQFAHFRSGIGLLALEGLICILIPIQGALAIPTFSRKYGVSCQTCHAAPPKLNSFGLEFASKRYQYPVEDSEHRSTFPISTWISALGHRQPNRDFIRGFPSRLEFIATEALEELGMSYFIEWRALSMELRGDGTVRDRSGRFEDLYITAGATDVISVTFGQFRMLSQVDVSQRISISEPVPFSSSLRGQPASTSRLTALRAFSPSGRSPGLRLQYHPEASSSGRAADGWFALLNVPFTGELSLPLTEDARREASFEVEGVPKGIFAEAFFRTGLTSLGGHLFFDGDQRLLGQIVGTTRYTDFYFISTMGTGKDDVRKVSNLMLEIEYMPLEWGVLAVRVEHQTGIGAEPAVVPYGVVHFPGTTYTIRLSLEQKIQKGNNQFLIETSLMF